MSCPFKSGDIVYYNNPNINHNKLQWLLDVNQKYAEVKTPTNSYQAEVEFHGLSIERTTRNLRTLYMTKIEINSEEYKLAMKQFGKEDNIPNETNKNINKKDKGSFDYNGTTLKDIFERRG